MALIDVVKYQPSSDSEFVWKYPSLDLKLGTQVVVNESQEAIFVKGGLALDILEPGTHTLNTGNIPLLNKIINIPFGGNTPFTAEIWYVNKTVKRDLKWGTPVPISLMDPILHFPINIRSFGKWGARIENSRSFITQIVGAQIGADADKIKNFFTGEIIQKLTSSISNAVINNNLSIMNISASINEISEYSKNIITDEFSKFGIEIINFNIESINIPTDEMVKIQDVFAKTMEARELSKVEIGESYSTIKSFEVLSAAAGNQSDSGGLGTMLNAGIGLGVGIPLGQTIGKNMAINNDNNIANDPVQKLKKLKIMLDEGLITEEIYNKKRDQIISEM